MRGKIWRKALAASLALLIVTGSVPIKPISNMFESMVVTAEAVDAVTKAYSFDTATVGNDRLTMSATDPDDSIIKPIILANGSGIQSSVQQCDVSSFSGNKILSNLTGLDGAGQDIEFTVFPNINGRVTKIEFTKARRGNVLSSNDSFSMSISGMKYNGTDNELTGVDDWNTSKSITFVSTDSSGVEGNLSIILGPLSTLTFTSGCEMRITYIPSAAPVHEHSYSFNVTGNELTATCVNNDGLDCSLADSDHKATFTLTADGGYYGEHVFYVANHNCASFNAKTGLNATADDIVYTNKSTGETSTSPVSAVGSYTATLVVHINGTDYTLTKDFVVRSYCEINNVYPQINISTADMPEATHAREGEKVTLSFTSMYGESLTELTVTGVDSNNSISFTDEGNGIYSFIMPSEGVNIGATFSTISISYLDENGETQTCNSATLLYGNETTLSEGWYVVPYDITYRNELALSGDVRLILANGTEMYIANWNGKGITADDENQGSIAIYGQAKEDEVDTGKLTINSKEYAIDLTSGTYAQYGGEVKMYSKSNCIHTVDGDVVISGGKIDLLPDTGCTGIDSEKGDITINGGNVRVEGYGVYVSEQGTITLGWTNETDRIYSNRYSGKVIIVNDKVLKDEDNTPYFGTISTPSELRYKTLSPYIVHIIAISDEITGGTVSADKVANTDDIVTLTVTPDAGYVLKSLTVKDSSNNPITVTNNQFTMPDSNVTVTAEFEAIGYTISKTADHGTIFAKVGDAIVTTANYGESVTLDVIPDTGYTVKSVKVGNTEIEPVNGVYSFTMPDNDVTVTAEFEAITYSVAFNKNSNDATGSMDNQSFTGGTAQDLTANGFTAPTGYHFAGWATSANGAVEYADGAEVSNLTAVNNDTVTLYAKWEANKHTVTYKVDGEVYGAVDTVAYGTALTAREAPTKTGYTFSGWSEIPATMLDEDVVITGSFIINKYAVTWKNGETTLETDTNVPYGTAPSYDGATPTKAATAQYSYTFSGWSDGTNTYAANALPTVSGNVTYTAQFNSTAKTYTITYKVDGEVYDTKTVSYGDSIALIDAPTREGYTFSGWQTSYTTMPASNIEITGTFAINTYSVTYMVDGVQYGESLTVDHGTKLTAPTAPAKNGAIFLGWTADGVNAYDFETPVTAETTLTAMWLDASGFITFSEGYAVTDNTYNGADRDYVGFRFDVNMDNSNYTVVQHGILYGMNIATFGNGQADANLRFTDDEATALMNKVREFAAQNTDTDTTDWIEVYIGDRRDGIVYARGFIIVTDGTNNYLIYSDVIEGSYNSFNN